MKTACLVLAIIFTCGFCAWCTTHVVNDVIFDRNCGGYLKRSADANTVETAKEQLVIAVEHMEKEDLTDGYTSILYQTPDEDVGFWYNNISESLGELNGMKSDATPLERSNMLMKLRETLLDSGSSGDKITIPSGIHVFPNNTGYAWWGLSCFLFGCLCWFGFVVYLNRY